MLRPLFLQPRHDVAADHDVDVGKTFLDHLAEREAGHQLHLRADGDADHRRLFFAHTGQHELIADVAVDVHLFVVEAGKDFLGDPGPIAQVTFHWIEHQRGRIVSGGDVLHGFAERVQRPLQLLRFVEPFAAHNELRVLRTLRQVEHVYGISLFQHRLLTGFLLRQPPRLLLVLERLQLHAQATLHPDQKLHGKEVIVHLDVDVTLNHRMPGLPQHGSQRRQREIGCRRHPLGREQEHDLGSLPLVVLDRRQAVDLDQTGATHSRLP